MEEITAGTLYIVATPIGNSRDMSPRGTQILTDADIIAAEDTRRSMVLLNKLGVKNKLVSNHKFNEPIELALQAGELPLVLLPAPAVIGDADRHREQQRDAQQGIVDPVHSASSSSSLRSSSRSSRLRPLSQRALAKAEMLPPQTCCTKRRLCAA